jgi:hypothetical protein
MSSLGRKGHRVNTACTYHAVDALVAAHSGRGVLSDAGDRVFHAVDGTRADTAPAFWENSGQVPAGFARIGLLFRDGH